MAAVPPPSNQRFWDQLTPLMEEGRVVPVVGRELVVIEADGVRAPLHQHLARRLAKRLEIPGATPTTLDEVARRYMHECRGPLEDIYPALKQELGPLEAAALPPALQRLASIGWFKLLLSTTFDDFLARAIDAGRYGGKPLTTRLAYGLMSSFKDLPDDLENLQRAVVYQLLGRATAVQDTYAVTDEDLLEFVHTMQIEEKRPPRLFEALSQRHLLLIGGGFSPWLVRFFLRAVKHRDRLWQVRGRAGFLVDPSAREDQSLVEFLRHYSDRTLFYTGGSCEQFVDELWARWNDSQGGGGQAVTPTPLPEPTAGTPRHAVFISYASEDRPQAEAIRAQLDARGIDTWFDRNELQAGQVWKQELEGAINAAAAFVPVLSASVLRARGREFRVEWEQALRARERLPRQANQAAARFIFPIVIDGTDMQAEGIRGYFGDLQATPLEGGQLSPAFCDLLVERIQQAKLAG